MKFYKWTADNRPVYGDGEYDLTGEPQPRIDGELTMCKWGYHVCTADQVPMWCGTELWEIEPIEIVECGIDKVLCRSWRVVRRMPWTFEDMVAYAHACDGRALELAIRDARDDRAAARVAAARVAAAYVARDARVELKWQRQWIEHRIGESL